jgi:oxygen-dependent protoporphyrinogen oxidase
VLGGGITGLASAFYLSQELPDAKITLYEGSPRLGGWLHSKHIDVGNGQVVFEQGPRTLRPKTPSGFLTLDLVRVW